MFYGILRITFSICISYVSFTDYDKRGIYFHYRKGGIMTLTGLFAALDHLLDYVIATVDHLVGMVM